MKVFMSWSGARSKATAELLCDWTKCVIQASRPWISTRGIDRGALWFSEINNELKDTEVGIVCLTHENKNKPWILFEAGALAKGLSSNRVCTFLVDLEPKDLQDPLAQFNHTLPNRDSLWSLVMTLNSCLENNALDERILLEIFNTYWPKFDEKFQSLLISIPQEGNIEIRSPDNLLEEILENTRGLSQRIRNLEASAERVPTWDQMNMPTEWRRNDNPFDRFRNKIKKLYESGATEEMVISEITAQGLPIAITKKLNSTVRKELFNNKS